MKTDAILPGPSRAESAAPHAYSLLVVSLIAFGFSSIFPRWADAPGLVVAVWRAVIAGVVLAIPFGRQVRRQRSLRPAMLRWVLTGGLLFAASTALFYIALDTSPAANVSFLSNLAPLWVGLITLMVLRQALPRLFWPGVSAAVAGAILIVFGDGALEGSRPGDLLALASSVIWSVYVVYTHEVRARVSALTWVWLVVVTNGVLLSLLAVLLGYRLVGYGTATLLACLGSGLIGQTLGTLSYNYALGHIPAARVAVIGLLQPVIAAVGAWLLLGESFGGWRPLGGALILLGVYLVNRPEKGA